MIRRGHWLDLLRAGRAGARAPWCPQVGLPQTFVQDIRTRGHNVREAPVRKIWERYTGTDYPAGAR